MTRQLSTLIKTGVPLMQALDLLTRTQAPGPTQLLLGQLQQAIAQGSSLADALRSSGQFSSLYISMVQAGESAGILDDCLERLADTLERNALLAGKVRSALAYPAVVMVIAMLVLGLIMVAVVPVFEEVFLGSGQPLPLPTQMILAISRWLQAWSPALLLLPLAAYALHGSGKTAALMQSLEKLQLRLPGVRSLVSTAVMARWSQTLAALLAAGVPLAEALPPAGQACDHSVYQQLSAKWSQQVAQGTRLSEALAQHGHVPALMVQMVHTGEETGAMALLLSRIGQLMDAQLQEHIRTLSTLMEPLIIVVLGLVIGGILVALYLPIFRMGQLF
jgi:type IV pilus assembly protein PilC